MWEGYNVAWSRTFGNYNIYNPIKTVNTGNKIADYVLGTLAGSLNILGSGLNIISNGIGTSLELQDLGIEYLDQNIPSYLTATGSFRQDLDAMAFIGLTNPELLAESYSLFIESSNYIINSSFVSKTNSTFSFSKQSTKQLSIEKPIHGNSLSTNKPAQGYALRDRNTKEILKYGETTRGNKRYSRKYLKENNAYIDFMAAGTKREMHDWQHQQILNYKEANNGLRPELNKSDW